MCACVHVCVCARARVLIVYVFLQAVFLELYLQRCMHWVQTCIQTHKYAYSQGKQTRCPYNHERTHTPSLSHNTLTGTHTLSLSLTTLSQAHTHTLSLSYNTHTSTHAHAHTHKIIMPCQDAHMVKSAPTHSLTHDTHTNTTIQQYQCHVHISLYPH